MGSIILTSMCAWPYYRYISVAKVFLRHASAFPLVVNLHNDDAASKSLGNSCMGAIGLRTAITQGGDNSQQTSNQFFEEFR